MCKVVFRILFLFSFSSIELVKKLWKWDIISNKRFIYKVSLFFSELT